MSWFINAGRKLTGVPELHLTGKLLRAALMFGSVPRQRWGVSRREAAGWCWAGWGVTGSVPAGGEEEHFGWPVFSRGILMLVRVDGILSILL